MPYKVLSTSKRNPTAWIVEGKNLSKSKAKALARRERGIYCGHSEGSTHYKSKKRIEGMHCYRVYARIMKEH